MDVYKPHFSHTAMVMWPATGDVGFLRALASSPSWPNASNHATAIWRRSKAKIGRLLHNASPDMCTMHELTCCLPYEIVEMITAHLAEDLDTLKACSLTCRSWYTAAAPHIHHTLILRGSVFGLFRSSSDTLSSLHELGLTPLVKEIRVIHSGDTCGWFRPEVFTASDLLSFSTFNNVRTLSIHGLDIDRFMPVMERYFLQFSPILRSISLYRPTSGAPQRLSYFLSLFPNLDDVDIRQPSFPDAPIPETELVPFTTPKLRGKLTLYDFSMIETWTHLIAICGVLQFRGMELCRVEGCTPILLEASAETLETLRLYVPGNASYPPSPPDLSQLKVLRCLEVGGWEARHKANELPGSKDPHAIVAELFSTIVSPVFSEFVVVVGDNPLAGLLSDETWFAALRAMNEAKPFKLVFLIVHWSTLSFFWGVPERKIEEATAEGLFDFLGSPPTIRIASPSPV